MTGPWWEVVGGRHLLTPEGDAAFAVALRLAARYAALNGVDYRAREGGGEYDRRLAALAGARIAGDSGARRFRLVTTPAASAVLTTGQAAAIMGLTRDAVVKRIARGELPARKVGRQWLITEDDARRSARDGRRPDAGPADDVYAPPGVGARGRRGRLGPDTAVAPALLAPAGDGGRPPRRRGGHDAARADPGAA